MKYYSLILFLLISSIALAEEPVKKTPRNVCYPPDHPRYEKIKNYIATYKTLEECIKSGGKIVERLA